MNNDSNRQLAPDDHKAASRVLCLAALLKRAHLEGIWQEGFSGKEGKLAARENRRLREWLAKEDLKEYFHATEHRLLQLGLGTWKSHSLREALGLLESAGTLAWALGRLKKIPPWDESFLRVDLEASLPILAPTLAFLAGTGLKDWGSLVGWRQKAELWFWRAKVFGEERQGGRPPEGYGSFAEVVDLTADLHHLQGDLPAPVENDFPLAGRPYRELSPQVVLNLGALAKGRLTTLTWLCGEGPPPGLR